MSGASFRAVFERTPLGTLDCVSCTQDAKRERGCGVTPIKTVRAKDAHGTLTLTHQPIEIDDYHEQRAKHPDKAPKELAQRVYMLAHHGEVFDLLGPDQPFGWCPWWWAHHGSRELVREADRILHLMNAVCENNLALDPVRYTAREIEGVSLARRAVKRYAEIKSERQSAKGGVS